MREGIRVEMETWERERELLNGEDDKEEVKDERVKKDDDDDDEYGNILTRDPPLRRDPGSEITTTAPAPPDDYPDWAKVAIGVMAVVGAVVAVRRWRRKRL